MKESYQNTPDLVEISKRSKRVKQLHTLFRKTILKEKHVPDWETSERCLPGFVPPGWAKYIRRLRRRYYA